MEQSTGKVEKFVEKPKLFVGNKINAGIYLLNPSVLDRIELRPTAIEKEVFPKVAAENKLYVVVLPGFWMDIGQPGDYITGLRLYLDSLRKNSPSKLANGPYIVGNVIVDETAKIGEGCLIGPDVAIGPGCIVESGVRLSRCTVTQGVCIKKHACISSIMFVLFLSVSLLCKSQCLQIWVMWVKLLEGSVFFLLKGIKCTLVWLES